MGLGPIKSLKLLPEGTYTAYVRDVHDGDTMRVLIAVDLPLRLDGIQAAELKTEKGKAVAGVVKEKILDKWVEVDVLGGYKYGANGERMGRIRVDGKDLSDFLVENGLAVRWDGKGPRPFGAKPQDADSSAEESS